MHVSIIVSRGSEIGASAYPQYSSAVLNVNNDRASVSISFVCADDAKRAALALLDAASQLRAPAAQGLVVEDVV